jgi:hypothetical protein
LTKINSISYWALKSYNRMNGEIASSLTLIAPRNDCHCERKRSNLILLRTLNTP